MPRPITRREFAVAGIFPFTLFRPRRVRIAGIPFRIVRRGRDRRHYIWIHGNETTAREVLLEHMRSTDGRAFLIENDRRNAPLDIGEIDPNRMFSRFGAARSLRTLNPRLSEATISNALLRLDRDRPKILRRILPDRGELLVALHNNSSGYSVKDEVPISDAVALNSATHPHEFMLCTARSDYDVIARSPFNVVLQRTAPPSDDGSLSRLCAANNVRYVNIEAALGNREGQKRMLDWLEQHLPL